MKTWFVNGKVFTMGRMVDRDLCVEDGKILALEEPGAGKPPGGDPRSAGLLCGSRIY